MRVTAGLLRACGGGLGGITGRLTNVMAESGTERARALRIRTKANAGLPISPEDTAWLIEYDERTAGAAFGASKSKSRKLVHIEEEEEAAAVGTGTQAAAMAAAGVMVREEGRRIDNIVDRGINALVEAVKTYKEMTLQLLNERKQDAVVQRALVEAVRDNYVKRAEAEAELIHQEAAHVADQADGDNPLEKEALQALIDGFAQRNKSNGKQTAVNSGGGKKR